MIKKVLIAAALMGILIYFINEALPSPSAYFAEINALRRAKNNSFRNSPESPIPAAQRAQFDSLKYYPAVVDFRITASISRNSQPDTVLIQTSDNQTEKYLRWGQATFKLAEKPQQLTLFRHAGGADSTLFVPFTDLSNGRETYGGGRYLDVARPKADASEIELDFNRSYNPYCAYNDEYSCPVPPAENRLPVAITAGEKSFHD
jgi:uncharacterized protein (DUF1684 family)